MTPSLLAAAEPLIKAALAEDLGKQGDLTTEFFAPPSARVRGVVIAKQKGVICGVPIAARVLRLVARSCRIRVLKRDGSLVSPGDAVLEVRGGRGLLTAERTALNFLQHLSGIATLTRSYVEMVRGLGPRVVDTRKTLPGWRVLAKYAVRCGGGLNHRMGLYDMALVKDNHWAAGGDVIAAAGTLRRRHPCVPLQIEAASLAQVRRALAASPDSILLDNMAPPRLKDSIALIRRSAPRVSIEVSGGVSLLTIRAIARLGPDRISVGRLTHSAPALDLSLELEIAR